MFQFSLFSCLYVLFTWISIIPAIYGLSDQLLSKLSPDIQKAFETFSLFPLDILVDFNDGNSWHKTRRVLMESDDMFINRGEKLKKMVNSLTKASKDSQFRITNMLNNHTNLPTQSSNFEAPETEDTDLHFKSFYNFFIVNSMSVLQADKHIILKIAADESVKLIKMDMLFESTGSQTKTQTTSVKRFSDRTISSQNINHFWPMDKIGATKLWDMGYKGKGVVVGSFDSGAMADHMLLSSNYRKRYGWYDPSGKSTEIPVDSDGHGTHTLGTMVGSHGYGVAPEAEWIACRNSDGGLLDQPKASNIIKCMEFMTCPWDALTREKDCSKAPHIINNSYGISRAKTREKITFYNEGINLWTKNGIIPVFAAGNDRNLKKCGSLFYPAELPNVIAVGATDKQNKLAAFSSSGPAISGDTKPDISAPGEDIWSASIEGASFVKSMSGTSMAAPHIAGVIALWLSKDPTLKYEQIYKILTIGANRHAISRVDPCESIFSFPNSMYGYGMVNATAILNAWVPKPTAIKLTQIPSFTPTPFLTTSLQQTLGPESLSPIATQQYSAHNRNCPYFVPYILTSILLSAVI